MAAGVVTDDAAIHPRGGAPHAHSSSLAAVEMRGAFKRAAAAASDRWASAAAPDECASAAAARWQSCASATTKPERRTA